MKNIYVLQCLLRNLGDSANKELISAISGNNVIGLNKKKLIQFNKTSQETVYACIGSILGWATEQVEVWGSGFISNSQTITSIPKPKKIHAVRGKLTRQILLNKGYECSAIYGDPFLLFSKFFPMNIEKKYKLGIIPHQIEKPLIPQLQQQFKESLIIDIQKPVLEVVKDICSCEKIAASCLHGQICADTYGIPVIWVKMSEKILGHSFKYFDYFSSINRVDQEPLLYSTSLGYGDLEKKFKKYNKPEIDLEPLLNVCPFRS